MANDTPTWKISWLGHSGFRIETGGQVLLVDPWLRGNPMFDESRFDEAIQGATHILLSHGHGDHASTAPEIAKATGAPVIGIYDLISWMSAELPEGAGVGMNKGGTVTLGDTNVAVTMVNAVHSSSTMIDGKPVYLGGEAGFMIRSGGQTVYFAGDTDVCADMGVFAELHRPSIGILPVGGHFTMDCQRAAFACEKFFNFDHVIPCHYRTFPLLAQSAAPLAEAIAPTIVIEPEVLVPIEL